MPHGCSWFRPGGQSASGNRTDCRSAITRRFPERHDRDIEAAVGVEVRYRAPAMDGGGRREPDPAVASWKCPRPSLSSRLFGWRKSSASNAPIRSFTWEFAVNTPPAIVVEVSRIGAPPDDLDGERRQPARLRHVDERTGCLRPRCGRAERLAGERGEKNIFPAVVV